LSEFVRKKILVSGGLGFIGSNLAIRLAELGAQVTIIDSLYPQYGGNIFNVKSIKNNVDIKIFDVRETSKIEALLRNKDYLFNLAGQTSHLDSMLDPQTDLEINAAAQLSILETCRRTNPDIKIIFASTRQIYGRPNYLPVNELHPIKPVDVNGINKLAGEQYHILYHEVYGLRTTVLRLTNTYGPRMRIKDARQTFLGVWIKSILDGNPISVFGDGLQLRDFNFVDDCVDALLLAAQSDRANGKVFNLGSSEVISLKALAQLIVGLGFGGEFILIPFPAERKKIDIGDYYGDYSLIAGELGWLPKIELKQGLEQTLAYYKNYAVNYK
jgi:UDP-glucose 4-epimerase